jgi:SAM-dependent methyltransferase
VVAGDISLNMLRIVSSQLTTVPDNSVIPARLNAYSLPLLDDSVETAVALQFFHFVSKPEQVVDEIKRVLKPGGMLIINGPMKQQGEADDVTGSMRQYYSDALKSRGVQEIQCPGWTSRQMEYLQQFFGRHRSVASDDLAFHFTATAGQFLARLNSRYTMFQIFIDPKTHEEAMAEVCHRASQEFGSDFADIGGPCCQAHTLLVYSD